MRTDTKFPFVSVIMPIRNEADFIDRSLEAVISQNYPHSHMEVLISDGMSTDNTRALINNISQRTDIPIKILDNPKGIVPTGFNIALAESKGEIIIRVDGHTIIESDYIEQCVDRLMNTDAENVGGRMNAIGRGLFGQAVALATSSPFGIGGARFHYSNQEEWVDTVYMGAWWKKTFDRLGGFDEEFVRNQDDEFNYRIRSHGGKILLSPTIKSNYYNRATSRSLWKQYYQYGFYKVKVMKKHPQQMRPRQFAPPILVTLVVGGALFAPISRIVQTLWISLVAIYLIADLAVSLMTSRKTKNSIRIILPYIFVILHFSYGAGFVIALLTYTTRYLIRKQT